MKTSLLELDQLGILAPASLPKELGWMDEADKRLLVDVHLAGEFGLLKATVKKMEKQGPESTQKLYANSFVEWLTDRQGRASSLILTGRGEEVATLLLRIARNQSKPSISRHVTE